MTVSFPIWERRKTLKKQWKFLLCVLSSERKHERNNPIGCHIVPPIIHAKGLTKRYNGQSVVNQTHFSVQPGEFFGILGPNGAGKTTTLRMMIGLTPVDAGELELFGLPMYPEQTSVSCRMGVVSQENNLDTDLTVAENIHIYGSYFGLNKRKIKERLDFLLEFAQLTEQRDRRVLTLSGGMMRRLVIARALVASPSLLVLDEPTTGLDPQARHLIWQRLRQLRGEGVTLLLTTHYMEEAAQLCDRLMIMDKGNILDQGTPQQLIQRHVEAEVMEIRGLNSEPPDPTPFVALPVRLKTVGDTLFVYTDDSTPVLEKVRRRRDLTSLLRPANLEDVFLKLTGWALHD